jgi:hypothetical protein
MFMMRALLCGGLVFASLLSAEQPGAGGGKMLPVRLRRTKKPDTAYRLDSDSRISPRPASALSRRR